MRKKLAAALAVMVVASACLTACSKTDTDAATAETATAETATGETAAIEYDLGLDDDGYFRNVTASKYIKMPKNYEKYTVSKDVYTVTDDAIQKELDAFQNNYNLTTEVTGRAAQNGDVVNIAYEGTVDGVAFTGGTSEDYSLQLGSGTFIDGFEDQIVGHNVGDSFDVTVTFPDGYGSTTDRTTGEQKIELSNKEAVFHVTLNKISEYSMTDADVTSIMSGKTLQDGTAITTTALLRDYMEENLRLNQVSSDVQQYFLDNMKVKKDITDLVDMNLQTNLNYVKQEAAAYDMDLETFVQTYSNYSSSEEYSESLRSDAEDGIKLSLAAQYLAEEQGYKPTEDDAGYGKRTPIVVDALLDSLKTVAPMPAAMPTQSGISVGLTEMDVRRIVQETMESVLDSHNLTVATPSQPMQPVQAPSTVETIQYPAPPAQGQNFIVPPPPAYRQAQSAPAASHTAEVPTTPDNEQMNQLLSMADAFF